MKLNIKYGDTPYGQKILYVEGLRIAWDKHAYECQTCGAIWQSKNIRSRNIFPTDDERCNTCDHLNCLKQICRCDPIV